jgi:hypothetical protein
MPTHFEVPVDTVDATPSVTLCDSTNGGDVWFRFRIASRELVYADTHEATWHTMIAFADSSGAPMLASDYHACDANLACPGDPGSQIVALLDPGTYHIVVSGIRMEQGTTTLFVRHIPAGTGAVNHYTPATGTIDVSLPGGDTVNGTCEHAAGGENTYWWTTCPSYRGDDMFIHGCVSGFVTPQVTYSDGDNLPSCSRTPSDCTTWLGNYGAEIATTIPRGAGLHALYAGAWGRGDRGMYTLMTTFTSH